MLVEGVVFFGELLDVFPDVLLTLRGEQRRRVRAPHDLEKFLLLLSEEKPPLEGPKRVPSLHGVFEAAHRALHWLCHRRHNVPRGGIPLDVGEHEVLVLVVDFEFVVGGEATEEEVTVADRGANEVLAVGAPKEVVETVGRQIRHANVFALFLAQLVKEQLRAQTAIVGREHRKSAALGLPIESANRVFHLHDINGDVPLADPEYLQIRHALLASFAELRHDEAEVVALGLPVHRSFDLRPRAGSELLARGHLHKDKPGGVVILLQNPHGQNVFPWRPLERVEPVVFQRPLLPLFILDKFKRFGVADADRGVVALGEKLAIVAPQKVREIPATRNHNRRPRLFHALARENPEDPHRLVVTLARVGTIPCQEELLVRRHVDVLHAWARQAHLLLELRPSPQSDTLLVERAQIGAIRRPLHSPIAPNLAVLLLALASIAEDRLPCHGVVPIDFCLLLVTQEELLAKLGIQQPITEFRTVDDIQSTLRSELVAT
mmetsp:Transcript_54450/g.151706  ORF Transcript_54450/g.151706 Transcript_54450/m.151706 type:complete len:491 (-) Transcript_54450:487-1959(-)